MSVLGFSSPSFSFGMDIMLPVDINRQLRDVLLSDPSTVGGAGKARAVRGREREALAVRELGKYPGVFVPEVSSKLTTTTMIAIAIMSTPAMRKRSLEGDDLTSGTGTGTGTGTGRAVCLGPRGRTVFETPWGIRLFLGEAERVVIVGEERARENKVKVSVGGCNGNELQKGGHSCRRALAHSPRFSRM